MIDKEPSSGKESKGFFQDVIASFGSHLEERVKSPFAGAFLASWVVINWKALLVLAFSEVKIEERIEVVSNALTLNTSLLQPLGLSALLTLGFYLSSTLFAFVIELYELARRAIERIFDRARWTSPSAYIELKRRFNDRTLYLEGLAADNLAVVDEVQKRALEANSKLIEVQKELADRNEALGRVTEELASVTGQLAEQRNGKEVLERLLANSPSDSGVITSVALQLGRLSSELNDLTHFRNGPVSDDLVGISRAVDSIYRQVRDAMSARKSEPLSAQELRDYLIKRYPALAINENLFRKVFSDMSAAGLPAKLNDKSSLDRLFSRTKEAVSAYERERPDFFKSSVDHLSKSLGFVYPEFREVHGFSRDTLRAFERYQNLLEP